MTVLSWNCRGLGQPRTVQELVCLVHTYKPKLVFLTETRQNNKYVMNLKGRLGLRHCITQPGIGKGAGIALFYDENVEIKKIAVGTRYIDVLIRLNPHGLLWRGTFVYGEPKAHERHHMWTLLRRIKDTHNLPWLMMGDFNETMWQSEHYSMSNRSERNMENFRKVLSDCNLFDLGFRGPGWTYNNKQEGRDNVRARLDRAVASPAWSDYFKEATVEHICSSRSDHLPILLRVGSKKVWRPVEESRPRTFRYEQMWERVDSLHPTIAATWNKDGPAGNLQQICAKIQNMQRELRNWANRDFGSVVKESAEIRKKLSRIWNSPPSKELQEKANKLARDLDELLLREELMWRQRSRAIYIRVGDKNTKWFQQKATWRRKKNTITKLKDDRGTWVEDTTAIHEMTNSFFKNLYKKEDGIDPTEILELVTERVDADMNGALVKPFTKRK
jgi:hypothetical protein